MSKYTWGIFHNWKIAAVNQGMRQDTSEGHNYGPPYAVTHMLLRCSNCGRPKTKTIRGTWTLHQLLGLQPNEVGNEDQSST